MAKLTTFKQMPLPPSHHRQACNSQSLPFAQLPFIIYKKESSFFATLKYPSPSNVTSVLNRTSNNVTQNLHSMGNLCSVGKHNIRPQTAGTSNFIRRIRIHVYLPVSFRYRLLPEVLQAPTTIIIQQLPASHTGYLP